VLARRNVRIAQAPAQGRASGDRLYGGFEIFQRPAAQPDGGQIRAGRRFTQLPDIACQACSDRLCQGDQIRSGPIRLAPVLDQPDAVRELDLPEPPRAETSNGLVRKAAQQGAVSPSASEAAVSKASVTGPEIRWSA
jgi:hypothetical protein